MSDIKIIKVSPKGQITIPVRLRAKNKSAAYILEEDGKRIVLHPIELPKKDENFAALAEKSFDFWDNPEDDIYDEFYK